MKPFYLAGIFLLLSLSSFPAAVIFYGDKDVLGTGSYIADPTAGATLEGLLVGEITFSSTSTAHSFPFSPASGEFLGTDQMFVGSNQTQMHEGYSSDPTRLAGPQLLILDYSTAVGTFDTISSFTLGLAADDFQFPTLGQAFVARINGSHSPELTAILNTLNQTGPSVQFFSVGLTPALLSADHKLTLEIDNIGDGGDGWAVDFLSVGVTTQVPEPLSTFMIGGIGALFFLRRLRR